MLNLTDLRALANDIEKDASDNVYQAEHNCSPYKREECRKVSEVQLGIVKRLRELITKEFEGGRQKS